MTQTVSHSGPTFPGVYVSTVPAQVGIGPAAERTPEKIGVEVITPHTPPPA